jgi:putative flippase GtrA
MAAIDKGYSHLIINANTGLGKTVITMMTARMLSEKFPLYNIYVITTSTVLSYLGKMAWTFTNNLKTSMGRQDCENRIIYTTIDELDK